MRIFAFAFLLLTMFIPKAQASLTIDPTSDGTIYPNGGVDTWDYLTVGGDVYQGITIFSTNTYQSDTVSQATLSINPYGLPLSPGAIDVYGFGTHNGSIVPSEYNSGALIGQFNLTSNLGYGQKVYLNVSDFLNISKSSPYVGFDLRGVDDAGAVFSSTGYFVDSPSQLDINVAPEPQGAVLFCIGVFTFLLVRKKIKFTV